MHQAHYFLRSSPPAFTGLLYCVFASHPIPWLFCLCDAFPPISFGLGSILFSWLLPSEIPVINFPGLSVRTRGCTSPAAVRSPACAHNGMCLHYHLVKNIFSFPNSPVTSCGTRLLGSVWLPCEAAEVFSFSFQAWFPASSPCAWSASPGYLGSSERVRPCFPSCRRSAGGGPGSSTAAKSGVFSHAGLIIHVHQGRSSTAPPRAPRPDRLPCLPGPSALRKRLRVPPMTAASLPRPGFVFSQVAA